MRLRLVPPALLATLLLGGCGAAATARLEHPDVTLELDEFRILPRSVSVPAGRVRIFAENHGVLTHNLVVELADRDSHGNPVVLARTRTIFPGKAATILTPALRGGRSYVLASTVANQSDLGMNATLEVRR